MAGPWEKYQAAPASDGPWAKYAPPAAVEASPQEQPGMLARTGKALLGAGLGVAGAIGNTIDRFTTAPLRAGLSSAMDVATQNPDTPTLLQAPEGLAKFALGAAKQIGRDPSIPPSAGQLAERAGITDKSISQLSGPGLFKPFTNNFGTQAAEPMKGGIAGIGGVLDPKVSNLVGGAAEMAVPIPGAETAKLLGKGIGPVSKMLGEGANVAAKAADLATGTEVASKALGATKTVAGAVGNAFEGAKKGFSSAFNAKQADDFGESVKTAMANGIDPKLLPEAVEFGHNSIMTRTARVEAEGITGQPVLEKFHQGLDQVRAAVHRDIEKFGGGSLATKPEAGATLREGFNQGVQRAFDDINTSHQAIIREAPDLRLAPSQIDRIAPELGRLEEWAQAKAANGITNTAKGQGQQILNAVNAFRRKGESYAGAYEALQEIGDVAFKSKNSLSDVPPDIARFRKLYGDISDAMIGTVDEHFGADQAAALRNSNREMHKIFGDRSLLGKIGESATSDEGLFTNLIEHGDTKKIAAIKEYLTPEQLGTLKGTFLHSMVKMDPQGNFAFRSTFNKLRDKWDIAQALFEPGELDNQVNLLRLGDKFGSAVMSTSGTGASNAIRESVKEIGNSVADNAISGGLKQKARAIGFDVSNPSRMAAQGNPLPPIMGLGAQQSLSPSVGKLAGLDWRKRLARSYSTQDSGDQ